MATVFLITLAAGMLGVLAMCRMDHVAWKFVRLVAIITLVLAGLVLAYYIQGSGWQRGSMGMVAAGLSLVMAVGAFVVLALAPLADRYGRSVRLLAASAAAAGLAAGWCWGFDQQIWPVGGAVAVWPVLASQILAAWLVGSVTLATALGHAYLTQTAMTIQPLRRLAAIFAAAVGVRVAWAILAGGLFCWHGLTTGTLAPGLFINQLLPLSIRGLVGLLIPCVFACMVVETARLRATQSATGILYFTLVLVCIGELTSLFLIRETGIAF